MDTPFVTPSDTLQAQMRSTSLCAVIATLVFLTTAGCQNTDIGRREAPTSVSSVPASERLYVAAMSLRKLGEIYTAESQRLERICPPPRPSDDTCRSRNVSSRRLRVATLHSRPDTSSPPAAFINAWVYFRPEYDLLIALDIEFADKPGEFVPWMPDTGAWDYSIHIDGRVRVDGEWVQFVDPVIRVPAWTPREPKDLAADLWTYVDPIAGHIFHVEPLEATNPNGAREDTAPGDYLVTRASQDVVEFRLEVESDHACGDDIPAPPVMPPLLRANPSEFFDTDGTPRFTTKYTKGC